MSARHREKKASRSQAGTQSQATGSRFLHFKSRTSIGSSLCLRFAFVDPVKL